MMLRSVRGSVVALRLLAAALLVLSAWVHQTAEPPAAHALPTMVDVASFADAPPVAETSTGEGAGHGPAHALLVCLATVLVAAAALAPRLATRLRPRDVGRSVSSRLARHRPILQRPHEIAILRI
jgi:hypothetical protein